MSDTRADSAARPGARKGGDAVMGPGGDRVNPDDGVDPDDGLNPDDGVDPDDGLNPDDGVDPDDGVGTPLSTTVQDDPPPPVGLGPVGWARWFWRSLTSMRVALILLFLVALASIPGSILPQRGAAPLRVNEFLEQNPTFGPVLDRLGLFDVFGAPWFAAIYLLLMVSLAGCILPRTAAHWRAMRSAPPAAPRRLSRLPEHRSTVLREPAADAGPAVLDDAERWLRAHRWRVSRSAVAEDGSGWVAAEKGYLRETGNLLFHVALLALLVAVSAGSLFGYRGQVIVKVGDGFANTLTQYDSFNPGRSFDPASLAPFSFTLDDFRARFQAGGQQSGAARDFEADVTYRVAPDAAPEQRTVRVNDPMTFGGARVYLLGHGYAPTVEIKDASGNVVFDDSVVFLPQDGNFTSTGVIKVPDMDPQLGFTGVFLPTAARDSVRGGFSAFPDALAPELFLSVWRGDLGLDDGKPQSVYQLDTSRMERLGLKALQPGQTWTLPDGLGTLTFTGWTRYASFNVNEDPGKGWALLTAVLAIAGLTLSLFVRRRRLWVRVAADSDGRTLVDVAGLARSEATDLGPDVAGLLDAGAGTRPSATDTVSAGDGRADTVSAGDGRADTVSAGDGRAVRNEEV